MIKYWMIKWLWWAARTGKWTQINGILIQIKQSLKSDFHYYLRKLGLEEDLYFKKYPELKK